MKDNTYYFSHDANARKDEKILCLLVEHSYEGYGLYWALVEMMFENPDTAISRKLLKGIAYDLRVDLKLLQGIITTCYNTGLFQADKDKIWSNSLRRRKAEWEEKKKRRSEAGKRGMASRWSSDNNVTKTDNTVITPPKQANSSVITKDNKGKERKGNNIYKPNVEEVIEYFKSKGYTEEGARTAHNYYEQNNWHDSNNKPVLAWKQKMSGNWFRDEYKDKPATSTTPITNSLSFLKKIS